MSGHFLCRFDDICPTMDWDRWDQIEIALDANGVKPILAVVPDNQDDQLVVSAARADFWSRVRGWQAKGWAIGLHGHRHVYETRSAGLVGINSRSEFAGLPAPRQQQKIEQAVAIFAREGVRPDLWVAPGHSFDAVTLRLLKANGIDVVSDGYYLRPVRHFAMDWVPQQLWRFRDFRHGLWTVCFHHNRWTAADMQSFERDVQRYRVRIVSLQDALEDRGRSDIAFLDRVFASCWLAALKLKRRIGTSRNGRHNAP